MEIQSQWTSPSYFSSSFPLCHNHNSIMQYSNSEISDVSTVNIKINSEDEKKKKHFKLANLTSQLLPTSSHALQLGPQLTYFLF